MLRIALLCIFICISSEAKMFFWPYGPSIRFESSEKQNTQASGGYFSGVGLLLEPWYFTLESEQIRVRTSEGNLTVKRTYQDLNIWSGYDLKEHQGWHVLAMGGVGLYKERIYTRIGSVEDSDSSKETGLLGMGAEVLYSSESLWTFSIGARAFWGESLEPRPQPGFYLKLGLQL